MQTKPTTTTEGRGSLPPAFKNLETTYSNGDDGLPKDPKKAFELWSRAAELGSAGGHLNVADFYNSGKIMERDLRKTVYHWEQAAMLGNGRARHTLGCIEDEEKGNTSRAAKKHWIIAAGAGDKDSLDSLRQGFSTGHVTKAQYEKALRDYQKYMDEVASDQRDRAAGRYKA